MAGFLNEFLAHLKTTGVAKTANFQLNISSLTVGPRGLNPRFSGYAKILAFRCEATELPGRQLVTNDSKIYGPTYKTPYQSVYQEVNLTFLETSTFFIRDFFETWIDSIYDSASNQLNYPNNYQIPVSLTQYDQFAPNGPQPSTPSPDLNKIATWHLYHAFPTAVNQMPLAWSEDGLHRVAVTMAYQYYTMEVPAKPPKQLKPPQKPVNQGSVTS